MVAKFSTCEKLAARSDMIGLCSIGDAMVGSNGAMLIFIAAAHVDNIMRFLHRDADIEFEVSGSLYDVPVLNPTRYLGARPTTDILPLGTFDRDLAKVDGTRRL
jgi:hypothetical protein